MTCVLCFFVVALFGIKRRFLEALGLVVSVAEKDSEQSILCIWVWVKTPCGTFLGMRRPSQNSLF